MFQHLKRRELEFQNPIRSLYPILLLVMVETFSNLTMGYIVAFLAGALLLFFNSLRLSRSLYMLLCEQMLLLLLTFVLVQFFYPTSLQNYKEHYIYSIVSDLIAMTVLLLSLCSVPFFDRWLSKNNPKNIPYIKTNLGEYKQTLHLLLFIFVLRIALFCLYHKGWFTFNSYHYEVRLQLITFVAIVVVMVYEELKVWTYRKMLDTERFLPIVNTDGKVIGREAYSVAFESPNRHIHPLVRVYVLQDGCLYMQRKKDVHGNLVWDTVVSDYLCYGDDVTTSAEQLLKRQLLLSDVKLTLVGKYLYEDAKEKQLVFVFCTKTDERIVSNDKNVLSEQLWSNEQIVRIQESYAFEVFPPYVKKELKMLRMLTDFK